ncbi:MAG: hypothetical protein HY348_16390 [Nitrospira defluvii]|nr:hypothetical protein [Nitrospira defluvii]
MTVAPMGAVTAAGETAGAEGIALSEWADRGLVAASDCGELGPTGIRPMAGARSSVTVVPGAIDA